MLSSLSRPPQVPQREDEPFLAPKKDRAVATLTAAFPTPEPTPERKTTRANRKDASTRAGIAAITKSSSTHVKGPGSHGTHVEYPLSGAADAGSSPDLTRGDSLYYVTPRGIDSKGVASWSAAQNSVMHHPSGATDAGPGSHSTEDGDPSYSSPPGEDVDSESITSHNTVVPPVMRRPPSEGVDSKVIGTGTTAVVHRIPSKIPGRFRAVKVLYLRRANEEFMLAKFLFFGGCRRRTLQHERLEKELILVWNTFLEDRMST